MVGSGCNLAPFQIVIKNYKWKIINIIIVRFTIYFCSLVFYTNIVFLFLVKFLPSIVYLFGLSIHYFFFFYKLSIANGSNLHNCSFIYILFIFSSTILWKVANIFYLLSWCLCLIQRGFQKTPPRLLSLLALSNLRNISSPFR